MRGKTRRPSGDCEIPMRTISCGAVSVISVPLKTIVPCFGWLSPLIERSVVDLPAPFAPIRVTTCRSRSRGCRLSEIGLDHTRVVLDLLRRSLGDLFAVVEHGDAVRDAHHDLHVMLDQEHGDVLPL